MPWCSALKPFSFFLLLVTAHTKLFAARVWSEDRGISSYAPKIPFGDLQTKQDWREFL